MYQGKITIEEIIDAFISCGAPDNPVSPKQVENQMLDQRLAIVDPEDYTSIYSFKMTVQDKIQRSSTNRPKGQPPFYFEGVARASYNLTEIGLNLNMAGVKRQQAEQEQKREAEQRSFLTDRTEPPIRPALVEFNGRRFVRDYPAANKLKQIYGFSCQVCGNTVPTLECAKYEDAGYVEVHHIRPLGSGHDGPDHPGNMLVLCPNHHAAFDISTMALNPYSLEVYYLDRYDGLFKMGALSEHEAGHELDVDCLRYSWEIWLSKLGANELDISDAELDRRRGPTAALGWLKLLNPSHRSRFIINLPHKPPQQPGKAPRHLHVGRVADAVVDVQ